MNFVPKNARSKKERDQTPSRIPTPQHLGPQSKALNLKRPWRYRRGGVGRHRACPTVLSAKRRACGSSRQPQRAAALAASSHLFAPAVSPARLGFILGLSVLRQRAEADLERRTPCGLARGGPALRRSRV